MNQNNSRDRFWKMMEQNQFVKSINSVTDKVEEYPPAIVDMEATVAINGEFDKHAIDEWLHQELQKAREEDKQNLLTVGWHKGEMDFGINCDIDELDIKQMHEFRVMVCVAIGQAENMWRRAREKQNPVAVNNLPASTNLKNI